jgi:hypothetical protein
MALVPPADQPLATRDELRRVERQIENQQKQLDVQFTRIAQLQADIDLIRAAWTRVKSEPYKGPERRSIARKKR